LRSSTLKLILNSATGFSITEVLIGGGILAGVALASAQLFKDQKFAQKRIEYDQKLVIYHQNLSKTINLPANCNATVKGIIPSAGAIPTQSITELATCSGGCIDTNADPNDQSFDAWTPGAYARTPFVTVNDWTDASRIWQVSGIQVTGRNTSGNVNLRINYTLNPNIPGTRTVSKDIVLNTRFDSAGNFRECLNPQESSVNNLQNDLCKSLNLSEGTATSDGRLARWDDATQTCIVDGSKDCSGVPGTQIDGIGADGTVSCKPMVSPTDAAVLQNTTVANCAPPLKPQIYFDTITKTMRVRCI